MCRVLEIRRRAFYAWLDKPESKRAIEDKRLLGQIKQLRNDAAYIFV
jgi:putative transposase